MNSPTIMYFSSIAVISAVSLLVAPTTVVAFNTNDYCNGYEPATVNVVSSTAETAANLAPVFEAFRSLLGGANHASNNTVVFPYGHRQINWDAGVLPFNMPGDFFANRATRGLFVSNYDDQFVVSNPADGSDDLFDSIDPNLKDDIILFSNPRLFSPLNDNEVDVTFGVPSDTSVPASVTGFGAIFADVDEEGETKMEFFDAYGCKLATEYVPAQPNGLSFVGVDFGDDHLIALVKITLGTSAISDLHFGNNRKSGRNRKGGRKGGTRKKKGAKPYTTTRRDVVVMDDFLYGEPQAIY